MKLQNLSVGQKFKFVNGNGKTWKKLSDNGDIVEYNVCVCIDNLLEPQKRGLMLISDSFKERINKDAEVIIIT